VITNLIENARSFVPEGHGRILVALSRAGRQFNVSRSRTTGPGIRAENIERIFERFYTDRPAERGIRPEFRAGPVDQPADRRGAWRQLTAENIAGTKPGDVRGARFIVTLPAEA
jgi:two-component system sensor histidine kinase ChvG